MYLPQSVLSKETIVIISGYVYMYISVVHQYLETGIGVFMPTYISNSAKRGSETLLRVQVRTRSFLFQQKSTPIKLTQSMLGFCNKKVGWVEQNETGQWREFAYGGDGDNLAKDSPLTVV